MAKLNWSKVAAQDLGRRRGFETMQAIPPIPGPPAAARKKNTYPCLPQPPRQKKKPKPRMVKYVVLADRVPAPLAGAPRPE